VGAGDAATSLHVDADSRLHRLPPQCKVAATVLFVVAVVATPREAWWAFVLDLALLVGLAGLGRVPLGVVARRLVLEAPFLAFAVLLPFVAAGPRVDVGPLSLSESGLWGAWNILAKGTLGAFAAVLLVSTTELASILRGLERLHVPRAFTTVAGFMVRYADVVSGELHRMSVARRSRGHDPRWLWQARAVAASAGALFVRSYERGERVYLAMVSRGYAGAMPVLRDDAAPAAAWAAALAVPALAAALAVLGWSTG
jgi:cobalt/nickel transport system permease protein